jgi:hypothetical protein
MLEFYNASKFIFCLIISNLLLITYVTNYCKLFLITFIRVDVQKNPTFTKRCFPLETVIGFTKHKACVVYN